MKHFVQSWPGLGAAILPSHWKQTSLGEVWAQAFLAFNFHLHLIANSKSRHFLNPELWQYILSCSDIGPLRLSLITCYSINYSLRERCPETGQELFCLRELVVSSNPRSVPEATKKPFFFKNHLKRWLLSPVKRQPTCLFSLFFHLWRDDQLDTSRYWLIPLVDAEFIIADASQKIGLGTLN